jgi:hypothetical protein
MMAGLRDTVIATALAHQTMTAKPVDRMAMPQRNMFYEDAEMPVSPRMAENLVGGQARTEQQAFQKRQRPVRGRWRGYEFGA